MLLSPTERNAIERSLLLASAKFNREARLPSVEKELAEQRFAFSVEAGRLAQIFKSGRRITLDKTSAPIIVASLRLMVQHLFQNSDQETKPFRKQQLRAWGASFNQLADRIVTQCGL